MAEYANNNLQRTIILFTSMIPIIIIGIEGLHLNESGQAMSKINLSLLSDDEENRSVVQPLFNVSQMACENETLCENPPYYPEDYIRNIADTLSPELKSLMHESGPPLERRKRSFSLRGEDGLCDSEEQFVVPRSGQSVTGNWFYVISTNNTQQWVLTWKCRQNDRPWCRTITIIPNLEGKCEQRYIRRKLAVVSEHGDTSGQYFDIPVACCCTLKPKTPQ